MNAQRVAAAGAGIVIDDPAEAGAAVRTLLTCPTYRNSAQCVGDQIRRAPDAGGLVRAPQPALVHATVAQGSCGHVVPDATRRR
ncbi:hypothetical protein GCM10010170_025200 [Dactylosporangium salmoneum]|uniref:Uncharacterized protein n=1 Tax=Dactylosporangium salmoneum TaxID=53361 RepID=A0ABN3G0F8_9ACTN